MPSYSFEAMQSDGAVRRGVIDAETVKAARGLLRAQALVPLALAPQNAFAPVGPNVAGEPSSRPLFSRRVFGAARLASWTRQTAGLVGSGLPLERVLTALTDDAEDERQRQLLAALRSEVNGGASLARALSSYPGEFPAVYIAVVDAGEQSGRLGEVLERLADDLEDRQVLKARLIGAALYPAIVTLVAITIMIFLMTYVVPQVAGVFAGGKRALPLLTQIVLALSGLVRAYAWAGLGACIAAALVLRLALRDEGLRERFDAAWLRLPLLGRIARDYNAARFAGTLALLAGAGLPILKALQAAAETLSNRAMRADALDALLLVREGAPLAAAISRKKRFPGLIGMFARLGEQTGQLPSMLQRAATQLSNAVQRRALALATLLEPLLILLMGLLVMLMVLAVLLPVIELSQWVK
jgi:general secretion pathway protein F